MFNLKQAFIWVLIATALSLAVRAQSANDGALIAALNEHRYSEAVELADASLKSRPADPWLWTVRGIALDGTGNHEASLKSLNKALALQPRFVPALKAASQFSYQHHDAMASEYLQRLLLLQPKEPAAHAMAGVLEFEAHHCARAIPHFLAGAELVLDEEASATEYASCLITGHRVSDAVSVLQQALALHPSSRNLRYDLALAQFEGGDVALALSTLQNAADSDSGMLNLRASLEEAAANPAAAFADLERAAQLSPFDERNYLDMALLCLDHEQQQRAVESLSRGIANLPHAAQLFAIRGIAYAEMSRYDEARRDFAQASALDPKGAFGPVAHGVLDMETQNPEAAKQSLLRQLEKNPNDPAANTLLADLLLHQGAQPSTPQFEQARVALGRALAQKPDSVEALNLMGTIEFDRDKPDAALPYFEKAAHLDPRNRTALNQMLLIYRKLGRKPDAARIADQLKSSFARESRQSQEGFRTATAR